MWSRVTSSDKIRLSMTRVARNASPFWGKAKIIMAGWGIGQAILSIYDYQFSLAVASKTIWAIWWFLAGVLSSIGLGTGFHTGLLYLFPNIIWNCAQAPDIITCMERTIPQTILFNAGSAFGELPPYLVAYHSKDAVKRKMPGWVASWYIPVESWMHGMVSRYGFGAVVLFAAWPNATFDMCGLICGMVKMNVGTFLLATVIGKSLIKGPIQIASLYTVGESLLRLGEPTLIGYGIKTILLGTMLYCVVQVVEDLAKKEWLACKERT